MSQCRLLLVLQVLQQHSALTVGEKVVTVRIAEVLDMAILKRVPAVVDCLLRGLVSVVYLFVVRPLSV